MRGLVSCVSVISALSLAGCSSSDGGGGDGTDAGDETSSVDDSARADGFVDDSAKSDTTPGGDTGTRGDSSGSDGAKDTTPSDTPSDTASDTPFDTPSDTTTTPTGLHVESNHLVDGGKTVRLLGVNHSGAEYSCVGDYGILEGPTGAALIDALVSWKVNTLRLPLNEQCWLGINGIDTKYAGDAYKTAIKSYVADLRARGIYVILDLHWAAPGTHQPNEQLPMADLDHAPEFWKSVATTFKGDPGVIFDLFNEPFLDGGNIASGDPWTCLQKGCTVKSYKGSKATYEAYKSAGMQDLVDAVRSTGAKNVIMVAGLAYTNDLSGWLAHKPTDPENQLTASFHLYNFNSCKDATCWATHDAIAKAVPLVTGEIGEDDCTHGFVDGYMKYADSAGLSYLGWTWNTWDCKTGPALISNYDGTPTAFGQGIRDHLRSL